MFSCYITIINKEELMSRQSEVLSIVNLIQPNNSLFKKVRVGSLGDGGYVVPDDLNGIESVLSIGIGDEVSFDLDFANKKIPVYQYDPTIDLSPIEHINCYFNKIGWGPKDSEFERTLRTMLFENGMDQSNNNLLKFDTEGAEWECIPNFDDGLLKYFRIVVCELHGLTSISNPSMMQKIRDTLRILTTHHTVVHLHANNCCGISLVEGVPIPAVIELSLLRNDRSTFSVSPDPIPGPLDFPNMADRPDLVLKYI